MQPLIDKQAGRDCKYYHFIHIGAKEMICLPPSILKCGSKEKTVLKKMHVMLWIN